MNLNVYVITMAFHTFLINRIRKIEAEQEKDIFFKQVTHVMSRSHSKVNPINLIKSNVSITIEEAQNWAETHTREREKTFPFFNHRNMAKETFPCDTVGGDMPGRPCVFPFKYPDCSLSLDQRSA